MTVLDLPLKKGWIAWSRSNKCWKWYANKPVWDERFQQWKARYYGQGLSLEMFNLEPLPISTESVSIIKIVGNKI